MPSPGRRVIGSDAAQKLFHTFDDVSRLLEIHKKFGGSGPGRRHNVEVLNRAAVVLLCAGWEAFIEDLAVEVTTHLAANVKNTSDLPLPLRKAVAGSLKGEKHELAVWKLSGDAWRSEVVEHVKSQVAPFNTPKPVQVATLLMGIGLPDPRLNWQKERAWTPAEGAKRLEEFVKLRGEIAHRGRASKTVTKKTCLRHIKTVLALAVRTDTDANFFCRELTGKCLHPDVDAQYVAP